MKEGQFDIDRIVYYYFDQVVSITGTETFAISGKAGWNTIVALGNEDRAAHTYDYTYRSIGDTSGYTWVFEQRGSNGLDPDASD